MLSPKGHIRNPQWSPTKYSFSIELCNTLKSNVLKNKNIMNKRSISENIIIIYICLFNIIKKRKSRRRRTTSVKKESAKK